MDLCIHSPIRLQLSTGTNLPYKFSYCGYYISFGYYGNCISHDYNGYRGYCAYCVYHLLLWLRNLENAASVTPTSQVPSSTMLLPTFRN
jgi:hypothetical protein